jgi:hypothetical protein
MNEGAVARGAEATETATGWCAAHCVAGREGGRSDGGVATFAAPRPWPRPPCETSLHKHDANSLEQQLTRHT